MSDKVIIVMIVIGFSVAVLLLSYVEDVKIYDRIKALENE